MLANNGIVRLSVVPVLLVLCLATVGTVLADPVDLLSSRLLGDGLNNVTTLGTGATSVFTLGVGVDTTPSPVIVTSNTEEGGGGNGGGRISPETVTPSADATNVEPIAVVDTTLAPARRSVLFATDITVTDVPTQESAQLTLPVIAVVFAFPDKLVSRVTPWFGAAVALVVSVLVFTVLDIVLLVVLLVVMLVGRRKQRDVNRGG